jgi:hypothetical protein
VVAREGPFPVRQRPSAHILAQNMEPKSWRRSSFLLKTIPHNSFDIKTDLGTLLLGYSVVSNPTVGYHRQISEQDDAVIPREESKHQQRLDWGDFVRNHEDMTLFRRHMFMSYDLFCTLLSLIS